MDTHVPRTPADAQRAIDETTAEISYLRKTPQLSTSQRLEVLEAILAMPRWHQQHALGGGFTVDSMWQQPHIEAAFRKVVGRGQRVLEVGGLEGGWAFLAERLGAAEVLMTDIYQPGAGQFQERYNLLHRYLESDVKYQQANLYDMQPALLGQFDVIGFAGVYYHLDRPEEAFRRLVPLLTGDGVIVVEGQILPGDHEEIRYWQEPYRLERDPTNEQTPTRPVLESWLVNSGLMFEAQEGIPARLYDVYRDGKVVEQLPIARAVYLARLA